MATAQSTSRCVAMVEENTFVDAPATMIASKGRQQLKKTFSFGHCPNHLNPPPPDPNSGNLVLFFRTSKFIEFAKMWGGGGDILTT